MELKKYVDAMLERENMALMLHINSLIRRVTQLEEEIRKLKEEKTKREYLRNCCKPEIGLYVRKEGGVE